MLYNMDWAKPNVTIVVLNVIYHEAAKSNVTKAVLGCSKQNVKYAELGSRIIWTLPRLFTLYSG